ncbi:hypothetical protein V3C99_014894 [Haemonchus contortus]
MGVHNCSTPAFPLIGLARIFYVASCTAIVIVSVALQTIFAMTCNKMKGWKSNFAFYLLQLMAIFSFLSYMGLLVSYVHGLLLFNSPILSRVTGSNFEGSFFAFVIANLCLTVHRLFYTLLPLKAQFVLTTTVEKICICSIILFYIVYVAITLSPLASVEFCAALFSFHAGRAPLQEVISLMDQVFCYAAGIVNVTAYTIMFTTLFIRGSLTFERNREVQMTIQTALASAFELTFFVCWEILPSVIPDNWRRTVNGYILLIYYDILLLPYMILNETVKTEMKKLFCKKHYTTSPVLSFYQTQKTPRQRNSIWKTH